MFRLSTNDTWWAKSSSAIATPAIGRLIGSFVTTASSCLKRVVSRTGVLAVGGQVPQRSEATPVYDRPLLQFAASARWMCQSLTPPGGSPTKPRKQSTSPVLFEFGPNGSLYWQR